MKNYKSILWYNQIINGNLIKSVRVRIFKPVSIVKSNNYEKVVSTDGCTTCYFPHSTRKHTYNYSYVVLSTGIVERSSSTTSSYIYMKVYITEDFKPSDLEQADDFLGKTYVIQALAETTSELKYEIAAEPFLPAMLNYFQKKAGSDYKQLYNLLKTSAHAYDFEKVEQLFKDYTISAKYQSLFWKEMYQETKNQK